MPKLPTHLFLSYCREDKTQVNRLREDLLNAGEVVWWDQDLDAGEDWRLAIRKAMKNSYAVVVCLSRQTEARIESGMYPELSNAIAAYRDYAPGSVYLIPVKLSECEIPLVQIDGHRTLDNLHFVELFPDSQWEAGVQLLVKALRKAPHHP